MTQAEPDTDTSGCEPCTAASIVSQRIRQRERVTASPRASPCCRLASEARVQRLGRAPCPCKAWPLASWLLDDPGRIVWRPASTPRIVGRCARRPPPSLQASGATRAVDPHLMQRGEFLEMVGRGCRDNQCPGGMQHTRELVGVTGSEHVQDETGGRVAYRNVAPDIAADRRDPMVSPRCLSQRCSGGIKRDAARVGQLRRARPQRWVSSPFGGDVAA